MKLLPILLLALCGCATQTRVGFEKPDGTKAMMERKSMNQKVSVAEVSFSTNGVFTMKGYQNDGGAAAMAAFAKILRNMADLAEALHPTP